MMTEQLQNHTQELGIAFVQMLLCQWLSSSVQGVSAVKWWETWGKWQHINWYTLLHHYLLPGRRPWPHQHVHGWSWLRSSISNGTQRDRFCEGYSQIGSQGSPSGRTEKGKKHGLSTSFESVRIFKNCKGSWKPTTKDWGHFGLIKHIRFTGCS